MRRVKAQGSRAAARFVDDRRVALVSFTGSTHVGRQIGVRVAERLGKSSLHAFQVSRRGGELWCENRGDRVRIGGQAVCFLNGLIEL